MEIPKNIYFKLRPFILPVNEILSNIPQNSNILDLGCGKGLLLNHIKNFKSYTGVDLNVPLLNSKDNNINFIKDDCIRYIDKKLNFFDTFLVIDLLHHIKSDEQLIFLNKLLNSMKKGDTLIIKDINPKNFITKFWNVFHDFIISKEFINYFDFNNFENLLQSQSLVFKKYHKRIFLYDHFFLIIKRN
tara:strand:+ start:266 stop:829 length:564 start_codon:yes stop_codon:yes gene_type:complete